MATRKSPAKTAGKTTPAARKRIEAPAPPPARAKARAAAAAPAAAVSAAPAPRERVARKAPPAAMSAQERYRAIAHAAYLRAEMRGFAPGHEVEDWLAAEAEFDAANRPASD